MTRTKVGNSIDSKLSAALKKLSEETRIPQSKLLDEAVELLLEKHGKSIEHNPLDDDIELLDLPPKIYHTLNKQWSVDVNTVGDLANADLTRLRGIGDRSIKVIQETLDAYINKK